MFLVTFSINLIIRILHHKDLDLILSGGTFLFRNSKKNLFEIEKGEHEKTFSGFQLALSLEGVLIRASISISTYLK